MEIRHLNKDAAWTKTAKYQSILRMKCEEHENFLLEECYMRSLESFGASTTE